ncbi:MAG: translocation/assembly module TamB [Deltaproteobacteria bacterium]|nr:translocation/assembly module TamB [Deltaproteobacteria bacterium]
MVEGAATIWLKGWEVQRFQGTLRGQKFQIMYLPDLRIQSSPRLEFQGTPQHLTLRGEVLLPEVEIYRKSPQEVTRTSDDVVLVDQPPPPQPALALDVQVRLILGDRVHVQSGGIDARMAGDLNLKMTGLKADKITGQGEIHVTEGSYSGYGLSMKITRGRFIFSGGPADNPALDVLALRMLEDIEKSEQIKVGVTIVGSLKTPVVKLYSQPAMADEQVLSYLILGHPLDPTAGNLSVLMAGARVLLSGEGGGLPAKIKDQLGLDVVDIQSSGQSTGQSSGQTTGQSTGSGDLSRSMVTIGKYLTPNLYIRYGYSAFSNEQLLTVRYKLSKNWEIETSRGLAMGINLFYKIEFY